MKKGELSYKEALNELQKLVEKIEDPKADLGNIAKDVKRATELVRICQKQLRAIEDEISEITG